ncbi:hypothetical protein HDU87_001973 [Geranomyces variabilis]|uniref:Uncharacterized protein n=1 Tax=Geranomyces variabilis TaxID=109894 RepID=A0AAD5TLU0_9FUNG|nr:hypothetical protein HDU87_001973 [Geranomyces variabilis]
MALPDDTLPSDLATCVNVLASLNSSIADGQQALLDQALNYGDQADSINWLRSKVPWFFGDAGTYFYYWARGPLAALSQWTISHLLYLRVSDALTRTAGRREAQICLFLTALVFPLELARQWYGAVRYTMTGSDDQMYIPAFGWFTAAYRFALDLGFNMYAFRMIYGSGVAASDSSSSSSSHRPRSRLMSEDHAFIVGYIARSLLFLASDILFVVATTVGDSDYDISFPTLTVWACSQVLGPIKPYLICTDMSRIRGLSADTAAASASPPPASSDTTKVQQSSGSKAGQDASSRRSVAKLKTAQVEEEP